MTQESSSKRVPKKGCLKEFEAEPSSKAQMDEWATYGAQPMPQPFLLLSLGCNIKERDSSCLIETSVLGGGVTVTKSSVFRELSKSFQESCPRVFSQLSKCFPTFSDISRPAGHGRARPPLHPCMTQICATCEKKLGLTVIIWTAYAWYVKLQVMLSHGMLLYYTILNLSFLYATVHHAMLYYTMLYCYILIYFSIRFHTFLYFSIVIYYSICFYDILYFFYDALDYNFLYFYMLYFCFAILYCSILFFISYNNYTAR